MQEYNIVQETKNKNAATFYCNRLWNKSTNKLLLS